jgi:hypothetical protein
LRKLLTFVCAVGGLCAIAPTGYAQQVQTPVEYVRICTLYGAGFHYIPGTDICMNDMTGDSRQQTEGGTWRTYLPYRDGKWVSNEQQECTPGGKLVKVGTFKSTDFALNPWGKKQTAPVSVSVKPPEFISKVMMSGGFYNPRLEGGRSGLNGYSLALCLRSIDPGVLEQSGDNLLNPPYGLGLLPIACVANSRIVGMPEPYAVTAAGAYPQIDRYFPTADQNVVAGPYVYGSQLVVTTDIFGGGEFLLQYFDTTSQTYKPLAGTLSVSVCVEGK